MKYTKNKYKRGEQLKTREEQTILEIANCLLLKSQLAFIIEVFIQPQFFNRWSHPFDFQGQVLDRVPTSVSFWPSTKVANSSECLASILKSF